MRGLRADVQGAAFGDLPEGGPLCPGRLAGPLHHRREFGALLRYLAELGEEKAATPGQLAIAWVLAQKPYIVPIPGMRSVKRLEENAKAAELALSPEELATIDAILAAVEEGNFLTNGGSYPIIKGENPFGKEQDL